MQDPPIDEVEATRQRLMNSLRAGAPQNPDALAQDRAAAAARGISVQALRAAREAGQTAPNLNWSTLPERAPRTTQFLSNPANAAVAHDDIENMSSAENLLRGVSARALNLGAGLGRALFSVIDKPADFLERAVPLGTLSFEDGRIVRRATTDADRAATGGTGTSALLRRGENATLGYTPMTTWEQVKSQPLRNVIPFALEQGIISAPDMAAAVLALPAYVAARTGEMGQDRAENNNQPDATLADLLTVMPAAVAESALERLGARGVIGLDDAVRGGLRGVPGAAARAGVKEAGTEALQEGLEYGATNAGTIAGFETSEAFDRALQGAVAGGPFGAGVRGATAGFEVATEATRRNQASAAATETEGKVIDQLNALSGASALRGRDPETFQQFIDEAAEGSNIENVYIDAQVFAQSVTPGQLAAITQAAPEIAEQLQDALATGGDLRISTGAFAAHIAGTDAATPMLEHLKIDPFAQSRAQAKEFLQNQGEELKVEIEAAVAAGQMDEAFVASRDAVRDSVTAELNTVGRFSADVNKGYATLLSNFYAVEGAKNGMTPEQMANLFPLKFSDAVPTASSRAVMDQPETLDLLHYSMVEGLAESDPMTWGRNAVATTRDERQRTPLTQRPDWMTEEQFAEANAKRAPGRTYFYDRSVRGGDAPEASIGKTSPFAYAASIPRSKLYDLDADPLNLRPPAEGLTPGERANQFENAIKAAGFAGYASNTNGVLGGVAVFEPLALRPAAMNVFGQSPITPAQADAKAASLAEIIPGLKGVLPYLTTDEKAKLRKDTAAKITKLIEDLPDAEEMAAVAYSGRAKRGWYENSAQTILSIFGAKDAPRFAALLAAMPPQISVEANAFNALATWTNWINAGRPQDRKAILKIMGESVQGTGTESSILNGWINNSIRALTLENPADIELSGAKVNSFMLNLIGVVDEVTNDAWMANYALIDASLLNGAKNAAGIKTKSPTYTAMNAVVRRAAEIASEKTGQNWTAAEVQETVWSWAKTLYEMRDSKGENRTAPEILAAGGMTADDIASTPDFAVLFVGGVFRRILEAGGYGAELDALDARGQPARRDGSGDPGSIAGTRFDEGDFVRYVDQAAARLEELRTRRRAQAQPAQLSLFAQSPVADEAPLEGQPQVVNIPGRGRTVFGPFAKARAVARQYMREHGWPFSPPTQYAKVDPVRAKRIADAFDAMKHDPENPEVRAAYQALIVETVAQWQAIKATGLKVEFIDFAKTGDPYAATPRMAILDVVENNHLWVFPTDDGFGSTDTEFPGNPLLEMSGEFIGDRELAYNDVFRIVHDYFGHIKDGNGFRADGEENAFQSHAAMYSPLARRAMTVETRGQNSWVNFGPKADFNRTASAGETKYADQKIGLLPEWVSEEGFLGGGSTFAQAPAQTSTPAFKAWFGDSKAVDANGEPLVVYHGTNKDFETFEGHISWFGSRKLVDQYTKVRFGYWKNLFTPWEKDGMIPTGVNILPVYAKVVSPFDVRVLVPSLDAEVTEDAARALAQALSVDPAVLIDAAAKAYPDRAQIIANLIRTPEAVAAIKAAGFDGVRAFEAGEDVWATFAPTQIKSAVGNQGTFDPANPNILYQNDPYYSALERAVLASPLAKASAAQWKATLAKTAGVKADEIYWTGLDNYLDAASADEFEQVPYGTPVGPVTDAKGNITREQIAAYLNDNGVRIEEVVLGDGTSTTVVDFDVDDDALPWTLTDKTTGVVIDRFATKDEADRMARDEYYFVSDAAYQDYSLPGENYGEFLLKVPKLRGETFDSAEGHFDGQESVIGHFRFNEADDATGARTLVVQEVQSTHHETGADQGYAGSATPEQLAEAQAEYDDVFARRQRVRQPYEDEVVAQLEASIAELQDARNNPNMTEQLAGVVADQINQAKDAVRFVLDGGDIGRLLAQGELGIVKTESMLEVQQLLTTENLRVREARMALEALQGGIQDAPFKKTWAALIMKRVIRYAVDNGFEKVAWINGNQQNGGVTGGDGSWFYERNLVNVTNDLLKKMGGRVEAVEFRTEDELARTARARESSIEGLAGSERPQQALGIQNGFTITDRMREVAGQGFPMFQPNRGQIAFGADITQTPSVISLLRTADLSTFLHETGHFFLEVKMHLANSPNATVEQKAEVAAIFRFFGDNLTPAMWNTMTADERRPYHEKFARGFEAYLFEGKSPSPAMRGLFRRFSAWLKNVYKSLTALDVELTDEVRGVFDRMLASADDIRVAEQARSFAPMMSEKPETMSTDEWTRYQELGIEATQEAIETLEQRNLRDMQWASNAKSRALRALQREANEQRKAVRAEVTAEVEAEPVNRARAFLRRGVGEDGELVEGAAKLDIATMRELYGEDGQWAQLKRGGKYGEAGNDGLHPDVVATMFGFASGEQLIDALVNGENVRDKINGLTDQRMLERYGDLSSPEALERAANEAVAGDARLKFIAAESAAADKAVGRRSILNEAAKEYAASIVNRLILKRLRPAHYLAAQGRAALAAAKAFRKGDLAGVATAKRNQLINLHAGRAVQDAQKDVEKGLRLFKRIVSANNDALSKTRDMDLVNASRAILMAYGMGRVKNDPVSYLDAIKRYDPTLYADIEPFVNGARADARPMHELTYEQFVGLRDTVNQLWTLSRRTRQVEIDGQLMDRQTIVDELSAQMDEIGMPAGPPLGMTRAATDQDKFARQLLGVRAALRRVESWARGLDKGDNGPFRRYIWNPISEAADRYRAESNTYTRRFRELVVSMTEELKPREIVSNEISHIFAGKAELYHALLHTGNGSNKSKLLLGRKWGKQHADGSLDDTRWQAFLDRMHAEGVLTAKDWAFVQGVWDLLEGTKEGAQKAHRQVYGRYFDEIAADPVDTPFGQLRGGYVPAMTDAFLVQDAALRAEQEAIEGGDSAMFPAASNGFTKSRVEDYTRELALDLRLLPMHIDKVMKFTHLGPPVRDVARILKNRAFTEKLHRFDPTAQSDLLLPWLQRAAKQLVETPSKGDGGKLADRFFSGLRSRVGVQLMFANVVNTAQQALGIGTVLLRDVKAKSVGEALWMFTRDPKGVTAAATQMSTFLRNRAQTDIFEARQTINRLVKLNPNKKDEIVDFAQRHAYFMQAAVQNVMDIVAWTAAYNDAVARGDDQRQSVRFADSVIRETQGTMAPEDLSRFETGSPFVRMFTQFYSWFNMMANLNATEVQLVARTTGLRKGAGRLFFVYLLGFAAPAILGDAVAKALRGGWEDEDDDGYMDDMLAWFFMSQAKFGLAAVPVVGQAANAVLGTFTEVPYDDRISMSPAISVFESGLKTPAELYQTIVEGESFNRADTRNMLNLLGVMSGLPAGAVSKPIGYGVGVAQGDIEPTGPVDVVRGAVTGSPSPESRQ